MVLLMVLILLALLQVGAMAAADVWALERRREQEQELLFVGEQYRLAIERYYYAAPQGTPRLLPASVDQLLEDDRYPLPVRHLRRAYKDPVTGSNDWGLVMVGNRISGVFSKSNGVPIKRRNFPEAYAGFANADTLEDWMFIFQPPASAAGKGAGAVPSGPAISPSLR